MCIYTHTHITYIYIYICICMCMCICMFICVLAGGGPPTHPHTTHRGASCSLVITPPGGRRAAAAAARVGPCHARVGRCDAAGGAPARGHGGALSGVTWLSPSYHPRRRHGGATTARRACGVGSRQGVCGVAGGTGEEGGTHADPKLGSMPRVPTRKGAGPRATEHTVDRSHSWLLYWRRRHTRPCRS